jgi:hypothetical protein
LRATPKNAGRLAVTAGDDLCYSNVLVLIARSFSKVPAFYALAPTGSAPPLAVAQGPNLVLFIILTVFAVKKFRPA